jgi:acetyl-CoA carboxylase biotin carboxyl carrier protein
MMDLKKIREIIRLIRDTDVAEIEVWDKDDRVRIRRDSAPGNGHAEPTAGTRVVVAPSVVPPHAPVTAVTPPAPAAAPAAAKKLHTVGSPFVGTFYRAPSPDRDPFVDVGTKVRKGQTLCIVEAMKLMNEIECEVAGTIVEILVENGRVVEYGQPLFSIEPA